MLNESKAKGLVTELQCQCFFTSLKYNISIPLGEDCKYDFILDIGNKLLRIQVKTSHWKDEEHSGFVFNCYSQHQTGNGNKRMKYTNKEIDFFMTEKDGQFYLYPAPEEGILEKTLRILPTKSGQTANISWAKDYIFEEVIKNY